MKTTTIQVSIPVYQDLNARKLPGESFDDVLRRVLGVNADTDASPADADKPTERPVSDDKSVALPETVPQTVDDDAAQGAIQAAIAFVKEQGTATKAELVEDIMPSHPCGYDVDSATAKIDTEGERYRGAWWRKIILPALKKHDSIKAPKPGGSKWRWE